MEKNLEQIVNEKYEDRGWERDSKQSNIDNIYIPSIPLSQEEYQTLLPLLAKVAIHDQNDDIAALYFDLQRRATYGNGFAPLEGMDDIEMELWYMGSTQETYRNDSEEKKAKF